MSKTDNINNITQNVMQNMYQDIISIIKENITSYSLTSLMSIDFNFRFKTNKTYQDPSSYTALMLETSPKLYNGGCQVLYAINWDQPNKIYRDTYHYDYVDFKSFYPVNILRDFSLNKKLGKLNDTFTDTIQFKSLMDYLTKLDFAQQKQFFSKILSDLKTQFQKDITLPAKTKILKQADHFNINIEKTTISKNSNWLNENKKKESVKTTYDVIFRTDNSPIRLNNLISACIRFKYDVNKRERHLIALVKFQDLTETELFKLLDILLRQDY